MPNRKKHPDVNMTRKGGAGEGRIVDELFAPGYENRDPIVPGRRRSREKSFQIAGLEHREALSDMRIPPDSQASLKHRGGARGVLPPMRSPL